MYLPGWSKIERKKGSGIKWMQLQPDYGLYVERENKQMDIQIGDVVTLKKQHPCGSKEWEVLRTGMDFRLKCLGCDHQVMIPRKQLEKNVRQIVAKENSEKKAE